MSGKYAVMLRCHRTLLHRLSAPQRGVTQSTPRLQRLGSWESPAHRSLIPDFQMFRVGDSHGSALPVARENSCFFSFEFSAVCWGLISDVWACFWKTCVFEFTASFTSPFSTSHACVRTHRQAHLHTPAILPPPRRLLWHTHLAATHSVNMKAVCRPSAHNYC